MSGQKATQAQTSNDSSSLNANVDKHQDNAAESDFPPPPFFLPLFPLVVANILAIPTDMQMWHFKQHPPSESKPMAYRKREEEKTIAARSWKQEPQIFKELQNGRTQA